MGHMGCFLTGPPPGSTKGSEFTYHRRKLTSPLEVLWKLLCTAILFLKDKFWAKGKRQQVNRRGAVVAVQVCASVPVHMVRASGECQPALPPPALQPSIKKFRQRNAQTPLCKIPASWSFCSDSLVPPAQIPWNHKNSTFPPSSCWWLKPQRLIGRMRPTSGSRPPDLLCVGSAPVGTWGKPALKGSGSKSRWSGFTNFQLEGKWLQALWFPLSAII